MSRTLQTVIPVIAILLFTSCSNIQLKDKKAFINGILSKKSHKNIMKFIEIVKFSHVNRVVYMIKLYSKKYLVTFES